MDLPDLDYRALQFWMNALQFLGLVALFVYTHFANKSKANASAIDAVKGDYDLLKNRVTVVEGKLENAPTHQDLSKVYDRLNDVAEDLSGARGQMRVLSSQLSMVNQYLLSQKGGQGQ